VDDTVVVDEIVVVDERMMVMHDKVAAADPESLSDKLETNEPVVAVVAVVEDVGCLEHL